MFVDGLGNDFLLRLGKYVATCASIEKLVWILVVKTNGYDLEDDNDIHRMLRLRKFSGDLRVELRKVAVLHAEPICDRMVAVADRIDAGVTNRNMAVHGAWSPLQNGNFRVEYYDNKGERGSPDWRVFTGEITNDHIDHELLEAEETLQRLIGICRELDF